MKNNIFIKSHHPRNHKVILIKKSRVPKIVLPMAEDILNEDFMLTTEKHRIVKRTIFLLLRSVIRSLVLQHIQIEFNDLHFFGKS